MNKVEAFKKELSCYQYYLLKLKEIDDKIALNFYEKTGVKGISYDKIPSHPSEEALANYRLTLIEQGDVLMEERQRIYNQIKHIEDVVNKLPKTLKSACIKIYVYGKSYQQVVNSGDVYWTDAGLFKAIERELDKLL